MTVLDVSVQVDRQHSVEKGCPLVAAKLVTIVGIDSTCVVTKRVKNSRSLNLKFEPIVRLLMTCRRRDCHTLQDWNRPIGQSISTEKNSLGREKNGPFDKCIISGSGTDVSFKRPFSFSVELTYWFCQTTAALKNTQGTSKRKLDWWMGPYWRCFPAV